jgi:type VI secretion system protein ImpK
MKPRFYKAVDPIFLYVLELSERVNAGDSPNPEEERAKICARLGAAETNLAQLGRAEDWEIAKYCLVAWIDELLMADLWPANSLEFELFRTARRSHEFFNKSEQASSLKHKDALECFYVAVVLGFRGMYSSPEALSEERDHLEFEPAESLEAWARVIESVIQVASDVPRLTAMPKRIGGAPSHDARFDCIGAWVTAAALLTIVLILIFLD